MNAATAVLSSAIRFGERDDRFFLADLLANLFLKINELIDRLLRHLEARNHVFFLRIKTAQARSY